MVLEQRIGFKPDHKSFGTFIMSEQARRPAVLAAEEVAKIAQRTAPRSSKGEDHMADKFKVKHDHFTAKNGNTRAGAKVTNDDPAAAPNEFGGKRNKRHRMLGKAGAAIGEFRGTE